MYLMKSALLVSFSLAVAAFWHLSTNAQETSNVETANVQIRTLQQERVDVLQSAVEFALAQYRTGNIDFRSVYVTQSDLFNAQLDMADTREERTKILTSQLKIARGSLANSEARFQSGLTTTLEVCQAKSAALHIEIQLLKLLPID